MEEAPDWLSAQSIFRPAMDYFEGFSGVGIERVSFVWAIWWSLHLRRCKQLRLHGLRMRHNWPNSDGIDPDGCRDVIISDCDLTCGDDCIVAVSCAGTLAAWKTSRAASCTLMPAALTRLLSMPVLRDYASGKAAGSIRNVRLGSARVVVAPARPMGNSAPRPLPIMCAVSVSTIGRSPELMPMNGTWFGQNLKQAGLPAIWLFRELRRENPAGLSISKSSYPSPAIEPVAQVVEEGVSEVADTAAMDTVFVNVEFKGHPFPAERCGEGKGVVHWHGRIFHGVPNKTGGCLHRHLAVGGEEGEVGLLGGLAEEILAGTTMAVGLHADNGVAQNPEVRAGACG